ncbi:MAG: hypothetical protein DI586_10825 [Micavibrio aeruginosavorus]|uniref:Uncharacterized protein n=1 Tax=Micavibrio aeruginosavorus TaxID=349221 RepID=A0A2W5H6L0_9BACT|nr:MAG: hypothetical protein DI586_10825 [Micavibrio aeruginosavorus]
MFSKLEGIFPGLPPRHVENANTRLEIRRDESENKRKKKDQETEGEYSTIPWEEIAYVSIASLKAFLESVVMPEGEISPPAPHIHEASNTINQRAAAAYQSVGRAVHDTNIQTNIPEQSPSHIETNFSDADIGRIRSFISDLLDLERRGIQELGMQRSENFLDSIGAAIELANQG